MSFTSFASLPHCTACYSQQGTHYCTVASYSQQSTHTRTGRPPPLDPGPCCCPDTKTVYSGGAKKIPYSAPTQAAYVHHTPSTSVQERVPHSRTAALPSPTSCIHIACLQACRMCTVLCALWYNSTTILVHYGTTVLVLRALWYLLHALHRRVGQPRPKLAKVWCCHAAGGGAAGMPQSGRGTHCPSRSSGWGAGAQVTCATASPTAMVRTLAATPNAARHVLKAAGSSHGPRMQWAPPMDLDTC